MGILVLCLLLVTASACTTGESRAMTLRVLASPELADMQPLLEDLRRDTGITLSLDYGGPADAGNTLTPGDYHHDLAWLSSDRYFQLKLRESGGAQPLSTNTMRTPVVIGVKPQVAKLLRQTAPDGRLSWADIADRAAAGLLRFGMADPRQSNSGLSALIGVATAAAGTGGALRLGDVTCDRVRGLFTGQTLTAGTSGELTDAYVAHQDDTDALIGYESVLLSLNSSGKLREPLEILYPADGMVMSEYPLLLLNPVQRANYDKIVGWLKQDSTQQKIMQQTLRRPVDTSVPRDPRLTESAGNALYFPDQRQVVDKLLADYADPKLRKPDQVYFLLDFSGSMKGSRISALRSAIAGLSGADDSSGGKFLRFYRDEKFTVIRFGGRVLGEQTYTISGEQDLDAMRDFVAADDFDSETAIWSTVDHAYQEAARNAQQAVSIVLMTDGESNSGMSLDDFLRRPRPAGVPTFTIRFGEANAAELDRAARATGGRMVDANATSLLDAFKEIRGCR
ncbi:VWA domain-containing protein [Amycolatopsis sp. RM579]|uniref:VWA domain-containing protein n=2 Tax=Amycolatopsis pithecellobii TaxID=664692 RepID=A0A6N7ZCB6_9PSEU|nr:VWA domain-containing protein [Amycolatopsis pithecellobii]